MRSLLMELCEDGKQMVKVTKLYKKNRTAHVPGKKMEGQNTWTIISLHLLQATHVLLGVRGTWLRRRKSHEGLRHGNKQYT